MRKSSPFHIALLSSKTCGLLRYANLEIRATQCQLPSVFKDRRSVQLFPIGTSPLPAERSFGLEPKPRKIKNPASSAGLIRPLLQPLQSTRPLERMCSKLDFFLPGVRVQPHLLMRRQTRSVRRFPGCRGPYRHQVSIASLEIPSSALPLFFGGFSVEITITCGNLSPDILHTIQPSAQQSLKKNVGPALQSFHCRPVVKRCISSRGETKSAGAGTGGRQYGQQGRVRRGRRMGIRKHDRHHAFMERQTFHLVDDSSRRI